MNLNERNISEFKTIISTQTEFSKLFEMTYGEVYDEELYSDTLDDVINALCMEMSVKFYENDLRPKPLKLLEVKNEVEKGDTNKREFTKLKDEFIMSYANAKKRFMNYFNGWLDYSEELIKYLNKHFKNYKFKETNFVNDYSILYFAFYLYDLCCSNYTDPDERKTIAEKIAKETYSILHKPYKRKIYVDGSTVLSFVKKVYPGTYKENYVAAMITFVHSVYFSKMTSIERYRLYHRFFHEIIVLNSLMKPSYAIHTQECKKVENFANISKKVYKIKSKLKNVAPDDILNLVTQLQNKFSALRNVNKNSDSLNKEFRKLGYELSEIITKLYSAHDEEYFDYISDIIAAFNVVVYDKKYGEIPLFNLYSLSCEEIVSYELRKNTESRPRENIYVYLMLLGNCAVEKVDEAIKLYKTVIPEIYEQIENNFGYITSRRYNSFFQEVDLLPYQLPLFNKCKFDIYEIADRLFRMSIV